MSPSNFPERDWKVLRSISAAALERYCTQVLEECAAVIRDGGSAHDRYLRLYELIGDRNDRIAVAFDDLRRSTATLRLAAMIGLGVVTSEELAQFTPATRESGPAMADILGLHRTRSQSRRRPTPRTG